MHVQCHDVTYDVTALINDVMSKNKMACLGCGTSKAIIMKLPENGHRTLGMVHPDLEAGVAKSLNNMGYSV